MENRISIVGIGNAGCKIIDGLAGVVKTGQRLIALNTEALALGESRATTKVDLSPGRTRSLGTGGDVSMAKLCAQDEIAILGELFSGSQLVFAVTGLGGGTGSGATPVVLEAAREAGATTLCFAVMPFRFEGEQRLLQADKALAGLRSAADALIVVHNDKFANPDGSSSLAATLAQANGAISGGIASIFRLITQPGFISLSFADLQRVLLGSSGFCTFGYAVAEGTGRAAAAVESLLSSPLLDQGQVLSSAKSLLVSIVGGNDVTLKEITDIINSIKAAARNCTVSIGTVLDDEFGGKVSVTVVTSEARPAEPVAHVEQKSDEQAPKKAGRRAVKPSQIQSTLDLDPRDRGRFKGSVPTILEGEDLDIPTYKRRGIVIDR